MFRIFHVAFLHLSILKSEITWRLYKTYPYEDILNEIHEILSIPVDQRENSIKSNSNSVAKIPL